MGGLKRMKRTAPYAMAIATGIAVLLLWGGAHRPGNAGMFHEKGDNGVRKPDVIWVPTPYPLVDKMLDMAAVGKGDVLFDLGCGDGRIVIRAAEKFGIQTVGYEIDPYLADEAKTAVREKGLEKLARIEVADIYTLDLTKASVITLYLLPEMNLKLLPQLNRCRPGTRVVSHDFGFSGAVPEKTVRMSGSFIYLWKVPIRVTGKRGG